MTDRETFLARWSRRKHAAAAEPAHAESPATSAPVDSEERFKGEEPAGAMAGVGGSHETGMASAARAPDVSAPRFGPASLPPIESIAADTDIRAFLAPGVPTELARAALRRAWTADPKIRDFVGLADYDWDFNAPGSMAGFGPLEMTEELRQIAARIIGPPPAAESTADAESSDRLRQVGSSSESPSAELAQHMSQHMSEQDAGGRDSSSDRDPPIAAVQNQPDAAEKSQIVVRPRHGGALPKEPKWSYADPLQRTREG
jgi:Protein of unknown function (DUF3306)